MPLQKLLFSATLTQNPEKLQRLGLYRPWLFSAAPGSGGDTDEDGAGAGKFAFPARLTVRGALGGGAGVWEGSTR